MIEFIAGEQRSPQSLSPGFYWAFLARMQPAFHYLITGMACAPSITRNNARFDPHHVKLTQSKALEQEHFDLRSKA